MRIIKRISKDSVGDDYLLAKIAYKNGLILMTSEEIIYRDTTNSKKKEQFNKSLALNKPYLYISPSQLLTLTAIKKDEKGYIVIDELEISCEKKESILSRKELENYIRENQDKVFIRNNILTYNVSIPTDEELIEFYKKTFSDYIFSSLTQSEKQRMFFDEYCDINEYQESILTLKSMISKMTLEDIPKNYNLKNIVGNLIMCQRCNNQLLINVLEIFYLEKDKYKVVSTNIPIKEYRPKSKNKLKSLN